MKTLIATFALLVSSIGFANTNTEVTTSNTDPKTEKPVVIKSIVYLWKVKTSNGDFTGTSRTIQDSHREMTTVAKNKKIYSRSITPVVVNPSKINKVYVWEVKTERGYARGVCETEAQAQRAVKQMNQGEVLSSKIVESFTLIK